MTPALILETIIRHAPKRPSFKTSAMATLVACGSGEFVTVSEFKDARSTLSDAVEEAFHGARDAAVLAAVATGRERADIVAELGRVWYVFGLVSLAALHKRVGADETIPADIRTVLAACAALKALIDGAKDKATPGRRPAVSTAPVKPRVLDMGTCAFCRRLQSVRGGMVEHGYTESRYGFRAGSCSGTNIAPLEVSPDGLHALLRALESAKAGAQALIDNPPTAHTVKVRNGTKVTPVEFTEGREFEEAARKVRAQSLGMVALTGERIPEVAAEIAAWKPGTLVTAAQATARGI